MDDRPNIVLFIADTTRADDAFDRRIAPTLADIGDAGMRVPNAFSTAPWTLPSHASMLTGTYPSKHGAHADHELLDDRLPSLSECLQEAGYETICVSNNTWLSVESGFGRGFDSFHHMWQILQSKRALGELVEVNDESRVRAVARQLFEGNPLVNAANVGYRYLVRDRGDDGARRSTEWIVDWIHERNADEPFFLLANYLEPHLDYRPPRRLAEEHLPADATYDEAMRVPQEPWKYLVGEISLSKRDFRLLRGLYRAEIAYVDEQLLTLRNALAEAGEYENTIFVVTADHGENVGDHGLMDHQYCLYDTLINVPLVLHGGPFVDREDLTDLVSLVDLAPTLLDVANVDAPEARESFQGRSFHPNATLSPREFVVSEYMAPQPSMDALERHVKHVPEQVYRFDRSLRAIRTDEYKLVRGSDGSRELYDIDADSGETTDVAESHPSIVADLESTLDEWLDSFEAADLSGSVTISGEREERLKQLGYLQ